MFIYWATSDKPMPEAQKGSEFGLLPQLTEDAYFAWYEERFGKKGIGKKFGAQWTKVPEGVGSRELFEVANEQMITTDYPEPEARYFLEYYQGTDAIEPFYYQCHQLMRDLGFGRITKITDVFTASEQSAFYGAGQQRLGLAQDRISQYLRVINDMVKGMFQIIRELRILDERLAYYEGSRDAEDDGKLTARGEQAELSLKGLWMDMVEGGTKNPGSVLGLSQQLGFTTLPDFFFRNNRKALTQYKDDEKDAASKRTEDLRDKNLEIAERIKNIDVNAKVKEVLARKLTQYYIWKDSTERELRTRRQFTVKYFRQYYSTIKLYITWAKPYLKQAKRLQMDLSKADDAQLISAFEGSMVEIEILAQKSLGSKNPFYSCVLLTLEHVTQPKLSFAIEGGFHRGPLHTGRTYVHWRGYAWTEKDIEQYRKYRDAQDFELLINVNSTLRAALEGVEGDIRKYLEEMGEEFAKKDAAKNEEKKEELDMFGPLFLALKGFNEPVEALVKGTWSETKSIFGFGKSDDKGDDSFKGSPGDYKKAVSLARLFTFLHYKLMKNASGILTW